MYQVEDLIRAYGLDAERIAAEYLPRFGYDETQMKEAKEWYESLARMMKEEGKEQAGHVRVVQNTLDLLEDHHKELLADNDEQEYKSAYYQIRNGELHRCPLRRHAAPNAGQRTLSKHPSSLEAHQRVVAISGLPNPFRGSE